jgi:hypothetical protein
MTFAKRKWTYEVEKEINHYFGKISATQIPMKENIFSYTSQKNIIISLSYTTDINFKVNLDVAFRRESAGRGSAGV